MELSKTSLQMVKALLPPPGTTLGCYVFLDASALWCGTVDSRRPFVAVAEEDWNDGALIIAVLEDGPVYIAERKPDGLAQPVDRERVNLEPDCLICYCAADFSKFMEIMNLYQAASESLCGLEGICDGECFERKCAETAALLRQQAAAVDPTAVEDPESLWSTTLEELGAGLG